MNRLTPVSGVYKCRIKENLVQMDFFILKVEDKIIPKRFRYIMHRLVDGEETDVLVQLAGNNVNPTAAWEYLENTPTTDKFELAIFNIILNSDRINKFNFELYDQAKGQNWAEFYSKDL